jgi:hypothetical protein
MVAATKARSHSILGRVVVDDILRRYDERWRLRR